MQENHLIDISVSNEFKCISSLKQISTRIQNSIWSALINENYPPSCRISCMSDTIINLDNVIVKMELLFGSKRSRYRSYEYDWLFLWLDIISECTVLYFWRKKISIPRMDVMRKGNISMLLVILNMSMLLGFFLGFDTIWVPQNSKKLRKASTWIWFGVLISYCFSFGRLRGPSDIISIHIFSQWGLFPVPWAEVDCR